MSGVSSSCCHPGALFDGSGKADGEVTTIGGVEVYATGAVDKEKGTHYVLYCPDVFGHTFINAQKVADALAHSAGVRVLIVGFLKSGAVDPFKPIDFASFPAWLAANPLDHSTAVAVKLLAALSSGTADSKPLSVQVIGFCYGAKISQDLFSTPSLTGFDLLRACVLVHPSFLTPEDAVKVSVEKKHSYLFIAPENDGSFKPAIREAWQKTLAEREANATFKLYPDPVQHGFCVRPKSEQEKQAQADAVQVAAAFFKANAAA